MITATGLQVVAFGQIDLEVDGRKIDSHETYVYKGMMFSGIPNFAWCVGYTNASWTLRADLTSKYVCRLINHMDANGYAFGMPDPAGAEGDSAPLLDLQSGYVQRVAGILPQQGTTLTVDDPAELVPRLVGQPSQRPRRGHGLDQGASRCGELIVAIGVAEARDALTPTAAQAA